MNVASHPSLRGGLISATAAPVSSCLFYERSHFCYACFRRNRRSAVTIAVSSALAVCTCTALLLGAAHRPWKLTRLLSDGNVDLEGAGRSMPHVVPALDTGKSNRTKVLDHFSQIVARNEAFHQVSNRHDTTRSANGYHATDTKPRSCAVDEGHVRPVLEGDGRAPRPA